jgi:hypothetical protein
MLVGRTSRKWASKPPAPGDGSPASSKTGPVLIEELLQVHFQGRIWKPEDFVPELPEAFGFGAGVGAPGGGIQKPDLGNAFGDVIVATFLNPGETVVMDDLDTQYRGSRRRCFEVELLA